MRGPNPPAKAGGYGFYGGFAAGSSLVEVAEGTRFIGA
jgi:hypothetical protein